MGHSGEDSVGRSSSSSQRWTGSNSSSSRHGKLTEAEFYTAWSSKEGFWPRVGGIHGSFIDDSTPIIHRDDNLSDRVHYPPKGSITMEERNARKESLTLYAFDSGGWIIITKDDCRIFIFCPSPKRKESSKAEYKSSTERSRQSFYSQSSYKHSATSKASLNHNTNKSTKIYISGDGPGSIIDVPFEYARSIAASIMFPPKAKSTPKTTIPTADECRIEQALSMVGREWSASIHRDGDTGSQTVSLASETGSESSQGNKSSTANFTAPPPQGFGISARNPSSPSDAPDPHPDKHSSRTLAARASTASSSRTSKGSSTTTIPLPSQRSSKTSATSGWRTGKLEISSVKSPHTNGSGCARGWDVGPPAPPSRGGSANQGAWDNGSSGPAKHSLPAFNKAASRIQSTHNSPWDWGSKKSQIDGSPNKSEKARHGVKPNQYSASTQEHEFASNHTPCSALRSLHQINSVMSDCKPTAYAGDGWISPHPLSVTSSAAKHGPQKEISLPPGYGGNPRASKMSFQEWNAIRDSKRNSVADMPVHRNFSRTSSTADSHALKQQPTPKGGWAAQTQQSNAGNGRYHYPPESSEQNLSSLLRTKKQSNVGDGRYHFPPESDDESLISLLEHLKHSDSDVNKRSTKSGHPGQKLHGLSSRQDKHSSSSNSRGGTSRSKGKSSSQLDGSYEVDGDHSVSASKRSSVNRLKDHPAARGKLDPIFYKERTQLRMP